MVTPRAVEGASIPICPMTTIIWQKYALVLKRVKAVAMIHSCIAARREAIADGKYVNLYANPSRGMGHAPRDRMPIIIGAAVVIIILIVVIVSIVSCSNNQNDGSEHPCYGNREPREQAMIRLAKSLKQSHRPTSPFPMKCLQAKKPISK